MGGREWTGSVAVLPEAMRELAIKMANVAAIRNAPMDESDAREMATFLADEAYTLSEWADAVEQLYARLDAGEGVTNAQGVRIAALLRGSPGSTIQVSRVAVLHPPASNPPEPEFLGFVLTHADGAQITGGIEPDGSAHT